MQFNVPVIITINNTQQKLTIHCSQHLNTWSCQAIGIDTQHSDTNLQHCIKKVVDHAKKTIALPQNTQTIKEI